MNSLVLSLENEPKTGDEVWSRINELKRRNRERDARFRAFQEMIAIRERKLELSHKKTRIIINAKPKHHEQKIQEENRLDLIISEVCKEYDNLDVNEVLSPRHFSDITEPRHVIMYLALKFKGELDWRTIQEKLRKARRTIIDGYAKIDRLMKNDAYLKNRVEGLINIINGDC